MKQVGKAMELALTVEAGHSLGIVSVCRRRRRRHGLFNLSEVGGGKGKIQSAKCFGQTVPAACANDGDDVVPWERTQAMAACATVMPFWAATVRSASTKLRF